jgi:SAM-dependent methyltransferase
VTSPDHGNWQKYQNKNPLQQRLIGRFLAVVAEMIGPLPIHTLLDVGCAEGFVLSALLRVRPDLAVAGLDLDEEALQRGRQLFPRVGFARANLLNLPCASATFDLVVCTEVLEHLVEPTAGLLELRRVSSRFCLFSVPHEPFFRLGSLLRGKNVSRLGNDPEHLQNWSQAGFVRFLSPYVDVVAVRRSFPWLVVLAQTDRRGG